MYMNELNFRILKCLLCHLSSAAVDKKCRCDFCANFIPGQKFASVGPTGRGVNTCPVDFTAHGKPYLALMTGGKVESYLLWIQE